MTSKELREYIYKNDCIITILENLGMTHIDDSNSKYISCGMPDGDNPCSTIIYKDEYLTTLAYTRNIKPKDYIGQTNIIHLIMFIKKCEYSSAKSWCYFLLGLSNEGSNIKSKDYLGFFKRIKRNKDIIKEQVYYDKSILNQYSKTPHIDLIRKDGIISQKIIDKYDIRFDYRSNRIIFPHYKYNDSNKIAGIVGRTVIKSFKELNIKKYMSMLPTEYHKKQNLYAYNLNIDNIQKRHIVIVFEAEKSVIKADMFGFPYGVSVGCHDISDFQRRLLLSLNCEVIIAFDKDVSEEHIKNICKVFSNFTSVSYIYDKWNLLDEKDSPVDKGHRVWEYLFRNRIKWR